MVVGRIVNGVVRIGTAWVPHHSWGWTAELGTLVRPRRRFIGSVLELPWTRGNTDV